MNPLLKALVDGKPGEGVPAFNPLSPAPPTVQIKKLRYTHEAMIDKLIACPTISQGELALLFDMTPSWISTIICSDVFQSKLAERRDQLVDPEIRSSLKTQFAGLLSRSMEILRHKLDATPDKVPDQLAVQVAKIAGQSLGFGEREARVSIQETHVHLEELGQNLVSLLRRRKAETYEHQVESSGSAQPPAIREGHSGNGAQERNAPPPADLGLRTAGEEAPAHREPGVPGQAVPAD